MSLATAELSLGHRSVMVAGGMESLSNSPFTLARGQTPYGGVSLTDTCNHDGLTDAYTGWHMGKCAEVMKLQPWPSLHDHISILVIESLYVDQNGQRTRACS